MAAKSVSPANYCVTLGLVGVRISLAGITFARYHASDFRSAVLCLATILSCILLADVEADESARIDFERDVAPLLSRKCLGCHSGQEPKGKLDLARRERALAGGESGPAIQPGLVEASMLVEYTAQDKMPPNKPLLPNEKDIFRRWIDQGAAWSGASELDPMQYSNDNRAGEDWWSFQPLQSHDLPDIKRTDWCKSPIDRFVLARIEAAGLDPSSMAHRRDLIRRLSFNLTGLPPEPDAVDAFVADDRPDAYDRLLDRLLSSPAYGEHWSRHWLDVAHFGESDGFEYDRLRPHAWPYRDWVIDALNEDLPFDEFARRQIAGDLLESARDSVRATGFLVGGAHDGLKPQVESMRLLMRQDELEDLTALVGQTFLGLTVQCARCHDHKFDPIRQTDYYQFSATLSGVHRGNRSIADKVLVDSLAEQLRMLRRELSDLENPARQAAWKLRGSKSNQSTIDSPVYRWDFRQPQPSSVLPLTLHGSARLDPSGLVLDGQTAYASTGPLEISLREKTLEAWVSLDGLQQRGGALVSVQQIDGEQFDAIVFGEREPKCWMAGSNNFQRTQAVGGPLEDQQNTPLHLAITYQSDGSVALYRNGQSYGKTYSTKSVDFQAGKTQLLFGLRHGTPTPNKLLSGVIHRAILHNRALDAAEVRESFEHDGYFLDEDEIVAHLSPSQRDRRQQLLFQIDLTSQSLNRQSGIQVFAVTPQPAPVVRVLLRGNPMSPGEEVSPGGLSAAFSSAGKFLLAKNADEIQRRQGLASWVTSQHNSLFVRTIANRLWHHHFGQGLVRTPNDLGFNGGLPSHPELLDWLAARLLEGEFSLKSQHRKMMLSSTYQQSSLRHESGLARDAENLLLWRHSPRRLSSEELRDTLLYLAGQMCSAGGGPGYQDFRPFMRGGTQFYERMDSTSPDAHRRTIYRTWARGGTNPLLDAFDCPDPSTLTPRRSVTNTPLQSLALLNNSFAIRMADGFANRLLRLGKENGQAIVAGFRIAYGRLPDEMESAQSNEFIREHGLAAWCRVLLNSNELLYVR